MKRTITILLVLIMVLSLTACGKSEAVKQTESAIDEIGTVSLESENAIANAEKLYNILTDKEKEKVSNRLTLVNSRDEYNSLVAAAAAAAAQEEAKLESAMCSALLSAIEAKQKYPTNPKWTSKINPNKTKYEVSTKEMVGTKYHFCGTLYLYDDYGNLCAQYIDGSGSYKISFDVYLNSDGTADEVKLK